MKAVHGNNQTGGGQAGNPKTGSRQKLSRHNIGADRHPDKKIRQQVNERAGRTDCRERLIPRKFADDNDIRRIEQKLQNTGEHERQCKKQQFPKQRSVYHIDLMAARSVSMLPFAACPFRVLRSPSCLLPVFEAWHEA